MPRLVARLTLAIWTVVLAGAPEHLRGQGSVTPRRLLDIQPTPLVDPEPVEGRFALLGGFLYYAGDDRARGVELFRASISRSQVELVRDTVPGRGGSHPFGLTRLGNQLFFFARDLSHGFELWRSDGTAAGTKMVIDLYPGLASSAVVAPRAPTALGVLGTVLLFGAEHATGGYGLWRSDGSAAGTTRLASLGNVAQRQTLQQFVTTPNFACFLVEAPAIDGFRVWRSDGTVGGTRVVLDLADTADVAQQNLRLRAAGDAVFVTRPGDLWRIDGSATTASRLLRDTGLLHSGFAGLPDPSNPTKTEFYFSSGTHLWKSDGTAFGTGLFYPRRGVGVLNSFAQDVAVVNGRMFFLGFDLQHGEELWSTDGTTLGTGLVVDVRPGPLGSTGRVGFGRVRRAVGSGSRVYFAADDGLRGVELYFSDGTAAGSGRAADIVAGSGSSNPRRLLAIDGGGVAFLADDGAASPGLYVFRPGQPVRKAAGNFFRQPLRTRESRVQGLRAHSDRVFFAADDGRTGSEPWCSDGTSAGTRHLADLWSGSGSGLRHHDWANGPSWGALEGISVGKDLFFTGYRGDRQLALFKSDGSTTGTVHLRDLDLVGGVGWQLRGLEVGGRLLSHAVSAGLGEGLFDFGSGAVMQRLADVWPGSYHRLGKRMIFTDGTPPTLRGVWVSDGTVAGTVPLVQYQRLVSEPFCTARSGRKMWFSSMHQGGELQQTDGSVAGTRKLRAVAIRSMVVAGDRLFALEDHGAVAHLSVGDGSSAGTTVLHSGLPISAQGLVRLGRRVVFFAFVGTDSELWVSDGTVAGTRRVRRFLANGAAVPRLVDLQAVGSRRVVFRLEVDKGLGVELWQSDGTTAGTKAIADLRPGPGAGVQGQMAQARGKLFFRGDDGRTGSLDGDLWVHELGATAYELGRGCAASGFAPRLSGTDPLVGSNMELQVDGTARTGGILFLGAPVDPAVELGFGCRVFVDTVTGFSIGLWTSASGRWHMGNILVPNLPGTLGLRLMAQAALGNTAQAPLGTDLSNALVLIAGN